MDGRSRTRALSVAILGVVFASGVVVGFAWDRRLDAAEAEADRTSSVAAEAARPEDERREGDGERRRRRPMYEQVDPTDAQRVRIDSIVEAYRAEMQSFHRQSRREYEEGERATIVRAREAIKEVLDPDQAARYDSLTAARDARAQSRERNDDDGDGRRNRD